MISMHAAIRLGCWVSVSLAAACPAFAAPEKSSLTSEQLNKSLKELGFEPEPLSPEVSQVSIERDGWKVHVMISLANDGGRIWLESKFAPIANPNAVPATAWQRLLEENDRISPAHFAFSKTDQRIHLHKAFSSHDLDAGRLKKEIDAFDAVVRRTHEIWRSENFTPDSAAPKVGDPEPAAGLKGRWRIVRIESKGESTTEEKLVDLKPTLLIEGGTAVIKTGLEKERTVKLRIDPSSKPKQIDFVDDKDRLERGIYMIETGLLTICVGAAGDERPRQFVTNRKDRTWLLVLRKE